MGCGASKKASKKTTPVQHCDVVPSAPASTGRGDEGLHNSESFVPEMTFKKKPDAQRRPSNIELLLQSQEQEHDTMPQNSLHRERSPDTSDGSQPTDQLAHSRVNSNNSGLSLASTRHLHHGSGSNKKGNLSPKTRQAQAGSPASGSGTRRPSLSAMLGLKIDTTKDPIGKVAGTSKEASPKVILKNRGRRPSTSSTGSASAAGTRKDRDADAVTSLVAAANLRKETVGRARSSSPRARRLSFQDVSDISSIDKAALFKRRPSVQSDLGPVDFDKAARAKLKAVQDMWDLDEGEKHFLPSRSSLMRNTANDSDSD
eukprot:TRINITY_DN4783_c0_g1_i1.p1 TRINITY_DN4783_c0_g1~~TRINITY_DN4783_c0_g1_i1.p1  ORF type:complete len:315 (-),score=47.84 TRINITY_DN4783_c0_g1_i1:174-1118(-)